MRYGNRLAPVMALLLACANASRAGEAEESAAKVKAVFDKHCVGCHGEKKPKGDLNLGDHAALLAAREPSPLVTPKETAKSELWNRVGVEKDMPPKGKPALADAEVAAVRKWIELGALKPGAAGAKAGEDKPEVKGDAAAKRAWAILAAKCVECHGAARKAGGVDLREHKALLAVKKKGKFLLAPGKPEDSRLWDVVASDEMPLDRPALTDAEKADFKAYIAAGAAAWSQETTAARKPVETEDVLKLVADHMRQAEPDDRPYLRYFTTHHLHNNPAISDATLSRYRAAFGKALNSMHWKRQILVPEMLGKEATVLAIDLRDLDWDRPTGAYADRWEAMMAYYPYGLNHDKNVRFRKLAKEIDDLGQGVNVTMRADWFVARATRPPLYERVLGLPDTAAKLEEKLGVDVAENFRRNKLARAAFTNSEISTGNRMIERHDSLFGAYWKSYDFKQVGARNSLQQFPLGPETFAAKPAFKHAYQAQAFRHDGGEMIFHLPNGLQGYFLTDDKDKYIPEGPTKIVRDLKEVSGAVAIVNGLSCMACHKSGMIGAPADEVRQGAEKFNALASEKIRRLYPANTRMQSLMDADSEQFLGAVKKATAVYLDRGDAATVKDGGVTVEPITDLVKNYYNRPVTLETMAHEVGMPAADLRAAIKLGGRDMNRLKLGVLLNAGGGVSRYDFDNAAKFDDPKHTDTSAYQKLAVILDLGTPR